MSGAIETVISEACLKEQVPKSVHDQMGHQGIERTLTHSRSVKTEIFGGRYMRMSSSGWRRVR